MGKMSGLSLALQLLATMLTIAGALVWPRMKKALLAILAVGTPNHSISTTLDDIGFLGLSKFYGFLSGDWSQIGSSIKGRDKHKLGFSVSLLLNAGTMLTVGLPGKDGVEPPDGLNSNGVGFSHIYQNQNNNWVQVGEIQGKQQGDCAGTTFMLNRYGTVVAMAFEEHTPNGTGADTG
jgi:hypothetical protein